MEMLGVSVSLCVGSNALEGVRLVSVGNNIFL